MTFKRLTCSYIYFIQTKLCFNQEIKYIYMWKKRVNISSIVINYKRITMIMIHFGKKLSQAKNPFNINVLNIEWYVLYNIQVE